MRLVAALIVSVALSAAAGAQNQGPRPGTPANESIAPDRNADAPWSDERMRRAIEVTPPVIDLPALRRLTPAAPPATPPLPLPSGRFGDPQDLPGGTLVPSERSGDPTSYPLRWAGRLFWSQHANGQWRDMVCSGQFIAPNMILTAAHCVRNSSTGEWGRNFQFALQFHRGRYNQVYRPACLGTKPDGYEVVRNDPTWRSRDYALLLTDRPSATGHFGWQLDWRGSYPSATAIGYPSDLEQGGVIQTVSGPLLFTDELKGVVAMQESTTRFGKGGSGGAWVGNFTGDGRGTSGNRVLSVFSGRSTAGPFIFGPYLDENFKSLYDWVANGCR